MFSKSSRISCSESHRSSSTAAPVAVASAYSLELRNVQPAITMKVVAACVAAVAALDCASAFMAPMASSTFATRSALQGRSSGASRARAPGLRMSAVSTDAQVRLPSLRGFQRDRFAGSSSGHLPPASSGDLNGINQGMFYCLYSVAERVESAFFLFRLLPTVYLFGFVRACSLLGLAWLCFWSAAVPRLYCCASRVRA